MTLIYSKQNVFEAAVDRIRWVFDEFPVVVASISGGKDSTTILELTLRVAREKKRLPLTVFWIDQEAEWTFTVDYCREAMHRPGVKPLWFQMPIYIENAGSYDVKYLKCWDPEAKADWIHKKDPLSIKENTFGEKWFLFLFEKIFAQVYPGQKVATIAGMRAEENRSRFMALTRGHGAYKWVSWAKKLSPGQYSFYPLYDWTWMDVWHAIAANKWKYNHIYDLQYQFGIPVNRMRVSALIHETSVRAVQQLQEFDPKLYDRVVKRIPGIATANILGAEFFAAAKPPSMFQNWCDYRDFLIEKLTANDPDWQATLRKKAAHWDQLLADEPEAREKSARVIVSAICTNDYNGTKIDSYENVFIKFFKRESLVAIKSDIISAADYPDLFAMLKSRIERNHGSYKVDRFRFVLRDENTAYREAIP
jgi:predicted phosphoadenosine phosphosulfate sulfurtransferase